MTRLLPEDHLTMQGAGYSTLVQLLSRRRTQSTARNFFNQRCYVVTEPSQSPVQISPTVSPRLSNPELVSPVCLFSPVSPHMPPALAVLEAVQEDLSLTYTDVTPGTTPNAMHMYICTWIIPLVQPPVLKIDADRCQLATLKIDLIYLRSR